MDLSKMDEEPHDPGETIPNLRKENRLLRVVLLKVHRHYKAKEMENRRVLMQCSVGLRQAAAQIERQNLIIQTLRQEREARDAPVAAPDSTT